MKVDDVDTANGHLTIRNNRSMDLLKNGRAFLGGLPEKQRVPNKLVTERFVGTIKNFIFSGRPIRFNEAVSFTEVEIGRDF